MNQAQVQIWKAMAKAMCYGARPDATEQRKAKLWMYAEDFIEAHADEEVDGWDGDYCLCDAFTEHFAGLEQDIWVRHGWYYKENPRYFVNHLRMAIRAGIDVAVGDGIGVIGFTVGDVKAMFGGNLPEWFVALYPGLTADTPDDAGIAL